MSTATPDQSHHIDVIAKETSISARSVAATAKLIAEGATVPFIARYRKEATGELDEVQITAIRDGMIRLVELDARRAAILKSLEERNLLTPELQKKILACLTMSTLEDTFAPFRPKRQTRATKAKDRGLEPLSTFLQENQNASDSETEAEATKYLNEALEVKTTADALAGARDIIAEIVADHAALRGETRKLYEAEATISSKVMYGKETEPDAAKFRDYFEWSEPLRSIPSHRLLAIRRGEKDGFLLMRVDVTLERVTHLALPHFVTGRGAGAQHVTTATEDACKRLLMPSMETEMRLASKKLADATAIQVFADNLRELLLASPLGQKRLLAIDPGFRTGCKTVVLDETGTHLHHTVLNITAGSNTQLYEGAKEILALIAKYKIQAIAIGNGTASRETETFCRKLSLPAAIQIIVVNESGASIYSASEVAREEFPDLDLTVRGAISIGRRLMDPLAELVKIDPKAIGVGQYQHDVDQRALKDSLDDTVISAVNAVGVEVNTASKELLQYVSGLNRSLAENIVAHRNIHGPFSSRDALKSVPRLGEKAFEQAAGFLRINGAAHPLDSSAVHPERYPLVEKMAADLDCTVHQLLEKPELRAKIKTSNYVTADVGLPTLRDIVEELAKPGRDPRKQFEIFNFQEGVEKPEDLKVGMKLPGIVTNVTAFGAFVDVGVHQDGLVHISQLSDTFVKDPAEVVKVGQKVQATVIEVDLVRKRIALSLKSKPDMERRSAPGNSPQGDRNNAPRRDNRPGSPAPTNDWFSQALQQGKKK
jgi:protein Tex